MGMVMKFFNSASSADIDRYYVNRLFSHSLIHLLLGLVVLTFDYNHRGAHKMTTNVTSDGRTVKFLPGYRIVGGGGGGGGGVREMPRKRKGKFFGTGFDAIEG